MDILQQTYFGNSVLQYVSAVVVAGVVWLLLQIVKWLVGNRLKKLAQRTATRLDDLVLDLLASTKGIILLALSLYAGSMVLALPESTTALLSAAAVIILLLQAAIWGQHLIKFVIANYVRKQLEDDAGTASLIGILSFAVRVAFYSLIALVALDTVGVDVTAFVTTLGIGGIAIGLALQNVLKDLFASVSIALDKPFVVGDFINVGDFRGTVEYIGIKTTRIRSNTGEQLVFANDDLLSSRLRNYKRMSERRGQIAIGVTYDTPNDKLAKVPSIIEEIITANENARFDRAHFHQFGDFSLNYEIVFWVMSPDYRVFMDTTQAINLEIVRRFREEGIEFAFPTQTIIVDEAAGEVAGAAAGGAAHSSAGRIEPTPGGQADRAPGGRTEGGSR